MLIVLDCPGCTKRYEVDAALAGKKSRCKHCGEVIQIPVPRALPASPAKTSKPSRPAAAPPAAEEWNTVLVGPQQTASRPGTGSAAGRPKTSSSPTGPTAIVINCPNCQKRYELDGALAGKKSRCKDCGETFSIPVPRGRGGDSPEPASPAVSTPAPWESVLEDVPSAFNASGGAGSSAYDEFELPPPPRAGYPKQGRRSSSRRDRGNNSDAGLTIAGFYVLLVIIVGIGFWIWKTAAEPTTVRTSAVFTVAAFFVHGIALMLGFAGGIWKLVIAFREARRQGFFCLFVPFYGMYYIISRWEDTKGAFALQILPVANAIVYATGILSISYVNDYEKTSKVAAAASTLRFTARRALVEDAEKTFRTYFKAIDAVTNRLAVYKRPGFARNRLGLSIRTLLWARHAHDSAERVNLGTNEWIAVKHLVGAKVRASLNSLKAEMTRIEALPGLRGVFGDSPEEIDKEVAFWTIKPGEATMPELIDVGRSPAHVATVPRPPAEQPALARNPGGPGRNNEPEFPPGADAVARSLIQLKSPEPHHKKDGLHRLERTAPDGRLAQVVQAVLPLLDDDDGWLVGDAIKVLAIWNSPEAVSALIRRTSDNRGSVRHEAIKALVKIKDPRGVEPIVARIKEDGFQVEDALKELGPMTEQALIERLTNADSGIRRRVCVILKEIGGKETLKAMQSIPPDPDLGVRMAADDAISSVTLRVGPLSPSERKPKPGAHQ